MKGYAAGFVLGVGMALAGYAVSAVTQVSSMVKVSCFSDGTLHVDYEPKP